MPNSLRNHYEFQLTGTLTTTGTSVNISNDLERDLEVSFTDAYLTIKNRTGTLVERVKGSAAAGVLTLTLRGLDQSDTDTEVSSLAKEWKSGTTVFVTIMSSQLVDRQEDNTFEGDNTFLWDIVASNANTEKVGVRLKQLTTAQRDAIATPTSGIIENTTSGAAEAYIGGAWQGLGAWATTPNASETVSGKVQLATLAEQGSQTEDGSTGAKLVLQSKNTIKTPSTYTPAFLTTGTNITTVIATWAGTTDGSFRIGIDGTDYNIEGLNFSSVATLDDVAAIVQTGVRVATGSTENVVFDTDKFIISSVNTTVSSAVTTLSTSTGTVWTDISGLWGTEYLDGDAGNGIVTNAELDPTADENKVPVLQANGKFSPQLVDPDVAQAAQYVLGEDVTAANGEGAVFIGEGITNTKIELSTEYELQGTTVNMGDNTTFKLWHVFTTPASSDFGNRIRSVTFTLTKVGSPTDNIQFNLFESDRTTPVSGFSQQVIDGSTLSTTRPLQFTVDLQDLELPTSTAYFLDISRSGAQNALNYFVFQVSSVTTAGYSYDSFNGAVWTPVAANLCFTQQYGFDFTVDQAWLTDARYSTTSKVDGIVIASGVAGQTVNVSIAGIINDTAAIGQGYYIDNTTDADRWSRGATPSTENYALIGEGVTTGSIRNHIREMWFLKENTANENVGIIIPPTDAQTITYLINEEDFGSPNYNIGNVFNKIFDFRASNSGTYNIDFNINMGSSSLDGEAFIYINEVQVGSAMTLPQGSQTSRDQDYKIQAGDRVALYVRNTTATPTTFRLNRFRVSYQIVPINSQPLSADIIYWIQ